MYIEVTTKIDGGSFSIHTFWIHSSLDLSIIVFLSFGLSTEHYSSTEELDTAEKQQGGAKKAHYPMYSNGLQEQKEHVTSKISLLDDDRGWSRTGKNRDIICWSLRLALHDENCINSDHRLDFTLCTHLQYSHILQSKSKPV